MARRSREWQHMSTAARAILERAQKLLDMAEHGDDTLWQSAMYSAGDISRWTHDIAKLADAAGHIEKPAAYLYDPSEEE